MYALADCNNFYASCERVFNPSLYGRPVVVLSNNDGCIIARSQESKELGILMGQPAHQIEKLLREKNVAVFSANFPLYGDMSRRVMEILEANAPSIEIYSIDEAFLDLHNLAVDNFELYIQEVRRKTVKGTGIPISIGVAPTKTLAKLANHIAKKQFRKQGYYILDTREKINEALKNFPIEDVWGIGRKYAYKLKNFNINTAWDFIKLPDAWVKKNMTVVGLRTKMELSGTVCIDIEEAPPSKKAICTSRSFGFPQKELNQIEEAVATFAGSCAEKLRKQQTAASVVMVFVHTNQFKKEDPQYAKNIVINLPVPTNSSMEIIAYAKAALNKIYKPGYNFKKAGVIVSGIVPDDSIQNSLFDEIDREKHQVAMKSLDIINKKYGQNTLRVAAQGINRKWRLKQEKLSPQYTTSWQSIINVKAED